jgi:mRNA-degrading endonuclease RelE of RelBE toxin-antitoxin system
MAPDVFRGDIKRLVQFQPSYRLRVGNYRVLFGRVLEEIARELGL